MHIWVALILCWCVFGACDASAKSPLATTTMAPTWIGGISVDESGYGSLAIRVDEADSIWITADHVSGTTFALELPDGEIVESSASNALVKFSTTMKGDQSRTSLHLLNPPPGVYSIRAFDEHLRGTIAPKTIPIRVFFDNSIAIGLAVPRHHVTANDAVPVHVLLRDGNETLENVKVAVSVSCPKLAICDGESAPRIAPGVYRADLTSKGSGLCVIRAQASGFAKNGERFERSAVAPLLSVAREPLLVAIGEKKWFETSTPGVVDLLALRVDLNNAVDGRVEVTVELSDEEGIATIARGEGVLRGTQRSVWAYASAELFWKAQALQIREITALVRDPSGSVLSDRLDGYSETLEIPKGQIKRPAILAQTADSSTSATEGRGISMPLVLLDLARPGDYSFSADVRGGREHLSKVTAGYCLPAGDNRINFFFDACSVGAAASVRTFYLDNFVAQGLEPILVKQSLGTFKASSEACAGTGIRTWLWQR